MNILKSFLYAAAVIALIAVVAIVEIALLERFGAVSFLITMGLLGFLGLWRIIYKRQIKETQQ